MGPFSQVPGLAGYQQQVAINDQQGAQQMMKLSQLMQMARQQQEMQQMPEDRAMKHELQRAQLDRYRAQAVDEQAQAESRKANAEKVQRLFALGKEAMKFPEGHPQRAALEMEYRMLAKPESVFEGPKTAALPWYVKQGPQGQHQIDPAYADLERTKASFGRPPAAPMAPVAYVNDKGETVWGTITEAKGRPAANFNPMIQGQISQAKKTGATYGEETTKAALDAPRIVQNAETALRLSGELKKHPGFKQAVGTSSLLGIQKIPGTDARDFMNRLDQLKGGAFLEAFNSLKGGGQITEVEGKKATEAIARMDNATSEPEFIAALNDFESVVMAGANRAKAKARGGAPAAEQPAQPSAAPRIGETRKGFVYLGGDPASQSSWKKAAK